MVVRSIVNVYEAYTYQARTFIKAYNLIVY
jgi:hypothetical protein